jgi:hypothetical protein
MVILALAMVSDPKVRLYNVRGAIWVYVKCLCFQAGIPEMRLRSPKLINAR